MESTNIEFYWPGFTDALPVIVLIVVLPAWLLWLLFRRTSLSKGRKWILVPWCILCPFLSALLWPLILRIFIRVTPDGHIADYFWVGTELFGRWSEYVWGGLTTLVVYIIHRSIIKKIVTKLDQQD